MSKGSFKALLAALLMAGSAKADQPVHCLREQLYGVWNFHVSTDS